MLKRRYGAVALAVLLASFPVLVLSGDRSAMGLQRIAEAAARCIKGARFVSIPQATHWMQHDQAEAFNDEVLAFLSRNGK